MPEAASPLSASRVDARAAGSGHALGAEDIKMAANWLAWITVGPAFRLDGWSDLVHSPIVFRARA
ncbi:MAG: hypothetical protein E5X67_26490 [Mesorhizobium sp.]|nr:MAG: hypothetical protein E5X67_26490 [Mesorhizobium sp.]